MERRTTHIEIARPFSLKATALSHGWHECAPMSWCEGGGCLQIIERAGGTPYRVSLVDTRSRGSGARVRMTVEGEAVSRRTVTVMAARMRTVLRADLDLTPFYELVAGHPRLALVRRIGGGRIVRSACMAENVIKAICATNANWTQAVKMINRIAQLGPCIKHFRSLNAWPTPREIAAAGEEYLTGVARVGYRAHSILAFCESIDNGSFDPGELDALAGSASTDELYDRLTSIHGVGRASAHFLLTLLGRFDRISVDSWTRAYVGRVYFNGRTPTEMQVRRVYQRFGEWQQLAWWFDQWLGWETARSMLNGRHVARK